MRAIAFTFEHRGAPVAPPLALALVTFRYEAESDSLIWPAGLVACGGGFRATRLGPAAFALSLADFQAPHRATVPCQKEVLTG